MNNRNRILITSLIFTIIAALVVTMTLRNSPPAIELAAMDLMKDIESQEVELPDQVAEDFGPANLRFGATLMAKSYTPGDNILISPISILLALAMTENGAATSTLIEMEKVLLDYPLDELNDNLKLYLDSLENDEITNIANSIWIRDDAKRLQVKAEFLQANANYYDSDGYLAPFDQTTLTDINNWIALNTDDMITDALDTIPVDAVMYLINTVLFEAKWAQEYTSDMVSEDQFTNYDNQKSQVEFLYGMENSYLEDDQTTGFTKDYDDGRYSFVALLPKGDIDSYLADFNGDKLSQLLENRQDVSVSTALPKFEYDYKKEMSQILSTMGMPEAFTQAADFSKMADTATGLLFIGRVIHNTAITLNEIGTKAGAVTIVEMRDSSIPLYDKEVILDRPFVYILYDNEMNVPLFMGTICDLS